MGHIIRQKKKKKKIIIWTNDSIEVGGVKRKPHPLFTNIIIKHTYYIFFENYRAQAGQLNGELGGILGVATTLRPES